MKNDILLTPKEKLTDVKLTLQKVIEDLNLYLDEHSKVFQRRFSFRPISSEIGRLENIGDTLSKITAVIQGMEDFEKDTGGK